MGHSDLVPYLTLVLLLISPFLFRHKSSLHYNGKFFIYYLWCSFVALLCMPIFAFTPKQIDNSRRSTYFTRICATWIGVTFKLCNADILAEQRGAIVVSNHQSTLDILGLFSIWEVAHKVAAVAKKELFYVWPFGLTAWLGGVVFIDRSSAASAYKTLTETLTLTNTEKAKIWLYPEGTRNKNVLKTKELLPFKRGAFKMAVQCQVPIIPVVYSPYYFLNSKTGYFGEGTITIKALLPIETKGLTDDDVNDLMERTRKAMQIAYNELYEEVEASLPPTHPFFSAQR